jgi:hypothetical protein
VEQPVHFLVGELTYNHPVVGYGGRRSV